MAGETALLQATSGDIGRDGTAPIVLRWETVGEAVGYRVLRRSEGEPSSVAIEANGATPVRVPQSAAELGAIVSPGSPEWIALARTLTSAQPGSTPVDGAPLVDPAEVFGRPLSDTETRFIQAGAQANVTMGRIAGLAFVDTRIPAGTTVLYDLVGVRADGSELVLATDVAVTSGLYSLPTYPSGLTTQSGDRRVLVLWNRNVQGAATYTVERATAPGGPFVQINPQPVAYDLTDDIAGEPLPFAQPGFLDAGAWEENGAPTSRPVGGVAVWGPDTGTTYWYRVAARDTFDRMGPWSPPVAATPARELAPMAPDELVVMPNTAATGLIVQWRTVTRNVENHQLVNQGILDVTQTSHIYRASSREQLEDIDNLAGHLIATTVVNPSDPLFAVQSWTDTDPGLVPPFGTQPFFYRVRITDAFGIVGAPSAVVAGTVPDTTPPGPTDIVSAAGEPDHIRVEWKQNDAPDVGGYQIYRGVCDHGYVFVPALVRDSDGRIVKRDGRDNDKDRYRCDMTLVGDVSIGDARAMELLQGRVFFDDFSIPANSPLCYAYWVRAYDHSGNLYAGQERACPREGEYVCAALREKTAPRAPVLTALRARNRAVEIEWIGAPEQDLRAFHVYRSELETDPGRFVACVFTDGTVQNTPWTGIVPSCSAVPAVPDPLAAHGTYLDTDVDPHRIVWYRVSAVDWLGNESESAAIERLAASATFTYTSDLPVVPIIVPAGGAADGVCGLSVEWGPAFDSATLRGFVVFRAAAGKPYRQVSGVVTDNGFLDDTARRGIDYAYRVQSVDLAGNLSEPSTPFTQRY